MKGYFKYKNGPAVGPFYNVGSRADVYNRMMNLANRGEAPEGRPGSGDMVAVGASVHEVTDFGFKGVASGPAGDGLVGAWTDGMVYKP
jgi:hypothetical protein